MREKGRQLLCLPHVRMRTVFWFVMLGPCLAVPGIAQRASTDLPNPTLTPGATIEVTREELCGSEYTNPAGKIPIVLKRQTFDRYGLSSHAVGYNVDHLIPASLGGSNSPKNLWPQSLSGEWNYHMKNRLERTLKKMVCRKEIALEKAQQEIATDWVSAYKKYILKPRPGPSRSPAQDSLR